MDELTDEQRVALSQFKDMTNGGDDDVAISMLQSVDWDVQVCPASLLLGNKLKVVLESSGNDIWSGCTPSSSRTKREQFKNAFRNTFNATFRRYR